MRTEPLLHWSRSCCSRLLPQIRFRQSCQTTNRSLRGQPGGVDTSRGGGLSSRLLLQICEFLHLKKPVSSAFVTYVLYGLEIHTSVPQLSNFLKVKNCACEFVTTPDDDPDPELDDPDEVSVDAAGPLTTAPDGGPPVDVSKTF